MNHRNTALLRGLSIAVVDTFGRVSHTLDFANPPHPAGTIAPGSSWSFQFWFRNPRGPGGSGFNDSDRATVDFAQ